MPEERTRYRIHGLDCAEEVAILQREVGPLAGGAERLHFDVLRGVMEIHGRLPPEQVLARVAATGMRAEVLRDRRAPEAVSWEQRARQMLTAASGALLAAGFAAHAVAAGPAAALAGSAPLAAQVLYSGSILAGVWLILPKAWFSLRRLRPDMNLLMAVAIAGAIALGDWMEAATVAFLFAVSLLLESWSLVRARRAVEALLDLAPATLLVEGPHGPREIPADEALPGTVFFVRPGERIGLDGEVTAGESDVNQAPLTGESLPVAKAPGAPVFAGSVNGHGALTIRATRGAEDTTLARVIRLVEEAQTRRAPAEQWVDGFARIYTPAVMALAVALVAVPVLLGQPFATWLYRALVLLVIACPCALVISTPVAIVAGLAAAARAGVIVKGGAYLEAFGRLRALAIDKTGTLTQGRLEVVSIEALSGHTEEELLERAYALEVHSGHPLAAAIVAYCRDRGVPLRPAADLRALPGRGLAGRFDGREYWLGSHRFLEERGVETPEVHAHLEELGAAGRTVVAIGNDEHLCGYLALADTIRPESAAAVSALRAGGIEHIVMLTGDNHGTAAAIARTAGIAEFEAELLPEDKVRAVENLVALYSTAGMVGDGINDAPAMGRATIGIAMGAAGSDAAIEAADVALMSDDLSKLAWLLTHSRRTAALIRANIAISLGIKALFVALTLVGYSSLWAAIAADMGVSLAVIANALRLLDTRAAR